MCLVMNLSPEFLGGPGFWLWLAPVMLKQEVQPALAMVTVATMGKILVNLFCTLKAIAKQGEITQRDVSPLELNKAFFSPTQINTLDTHRAKLTERNQYKFGCMFTWLCLLAPIIRAIINEKQYYGPSVLSCLKPKRVEQLVATIQWHCGKKDR